MPLREQACITHLHALLLLGRLPGRRRGHDADVVHEREVGGGHDEESREGCAAGGPEGPGEVPVGVVVEAVCGQDGLHRGRRQPAHEHNARLQRANSSLKSAAWTCPLTVLRCLLDRTAAVHSIETTSLSSRYICGCRHQVHGGGHRSLWQSRSIMEDQSDTNLCLSSTMTCLRPYA